MNRKWDLGVQTYKMKQSVAELGHSDIFTNIVDPNKIYIDPNI